MTAPDFPISTERLLLRPFEQGDLDRLLETYGSPDVCRWLLHEPWSRAQAGENLAKRLLRTDYADGGALSLVMEVDGDYAGDVVLFEVEGQPLTGELGWVVHPDHTGHGYAAEAARELLTLGFARYGLHRVLANLDGRNTASARVCERLGLRREAHHVADYWSKGEWTDTLVYALLDTEFDPGLEESRPPEGPS